MQPANEQAGASSWGRVDADGTVYVRTGDGERAVGSWQAGAPEEGLAYYARRYDELATEVDLLEKRVDGPADPRQVRSSAERLRDSLATASVVGDLEALDRRLATVLEAADRRQVQAKAERAAAAERAEAAKRALAEEAESLAQSSEWKAAGDRLRAILDEWRQIRGVERKADQELWRRYSAARDEFNRRRGAHFAALDEQRKVAEARKRELATEAESLADSTEWGPTARRFRDLMSEWRAAGRAAKSADDALWERFRTAQQAFFSRRDEVFAERDAEYRENQKVKEALLAEAEALDPAADLEGAQRGLRDIQERWDAAGRVPRDAMHSLESRMSAVADRVRAAADARWRRPAAESSPLVIRLRESVGKLEARAAKARAEGRTRDAAEVEQTLETQRQWLAQAEQAGES